MASDSETMTLVDFALRQIASESYLDGFDTQSPDEVRRALIAGNNDLEFVGPDERGNLQGSTRLTVGLVDRFLDGNEIIDHHANDATGFSATLTRDKTTGEHTLSFRSTEYRSQKVGGDFERDRSPTTIPTPGLGANAEIFSHGFALGQLLAMRKYYDSLVSSGQLSSGSKLNITGYSLGGHLAKIFTELNYLNVEHAYTFNSPGRGGFFGVERQEGLEAQEIGSMLSQLDSVLYNPSAADPMRYTTSPEDDLAIDLHSAALEAWETDPDWDPFKAGSSDNVYLDPRYKWAKYVAVQNYEPRGRLIGGQSRSDGAFSKITNIVGRATYRDSEWVANSHDHAAPHYVFIEDQPDVSGLGGVFGLPGDYGDTHGITLIADSLLIQALFEEVHSAPTSELTQSEIETILAASGTQRAAGYVDNANGVSEGNTLENALDALYQLFTGNSDRLDYIREGGGFGDLKNRTAFHQRIEDVRAALGPEARTVRSVVEMSGEELAIAASDTTGPDVAYRHTLRQLNPFVVIGADYLKHDGNAELSNLSHAYLIDRAEMLAWKNRVSYGKSAVDVDGTHYHDAGVPKIFEDAESGFKLNVNSRSYRGHPEASEPGLRQIKFGSDDNREKEIIAGGRNDDRLFGGGGNDELIGNAGKDYLEGGAGDDVLLGGAGNDELVGNGDNDILNGGVGHNRLSGGDGFDRYIVSAGDTHNTIVDSDGIGSIELDGSVITGGIGYDNGVYGSADGKHSFRFVTGSAERGTLLINETIEVVDFRNGDLGVTLTSAPRLSPAGPFSQDINGIALGERFMFAVGSAASDRLAHVIWANGDWGDDVLSVAKRAYSYGDVPFVSGGPGDDVVLSEYDNGFNPIGSSSQKVKLTGGAGGDVLIGGSDGEIIYGDIESFWSQARSDGRSTFRMDGLVFGIDRINGNKGPRPYVNAVYEHRAWRQHVFGGVSSEYPRIAVNSEVESFLYALGLSSANDPAPGYDDHIEGEGGNDKLFGGSGSDVVLGGPGNDILRGDGYPDADVTSQFWWQQQRHVSGAAFPEQAYVSYGREIFGWSDLVNYFQSDAALTELGYQLPLDLLGRPGDDWLDGGEGGDNITDVWNGNDVLLGGAGDFRDDVRNFDYSTSEGFANYLEGGAGSDWIQSQNYSVNGSDTLVGGTGNDTFVVDQHAIWDANVAPGLTQELYTNVEIYDEQGSDTYRIDFRPGLHVSVTDFDPDGSGFDQLHFDIKRAPGDSFRVARSDNDLVISIGDAAEASARFQNWFLDPRYRIEKVVYGNYRERVDGQLVLVTPTLTADELELLVEPDYVPTSIGTDSDDSLNGWGAEDLMYGGAGDDTMHGFAGADRLDGGAGNDTLIGGLGDDTYVFNYGDGVDQIIDVSTIGEPNRIEFGAGIAPDMISIDQASSLIRVGTNGDEIHLRVSGADSTGSSRAIGSFDFADGASLSYDKLRSRGIDLRGTTGDDFISGSSLDDRIDGLAGSDVLQGLHGDDVLNNASGVALIDGGAGKDTLMGSSASEFFIGGAGADAVVTGGGADLIGFNRGDGVDTIESNGSAGDTLLLGGGIKYEDLGLSKSNQDLVLTAGSGDAVRLKDWYSSTPHNNVVNLQVVAEAMADFDASSADLLRSSKVLTFDFKAIASSFDAAGQVDNWSLSNALLDAHLAASDSEALGGDLAYQYGVNGSFMGIGVTAARDVLNSPQFGAKPQTLRQLHELTQGQNKLS